MKKSFVIILLLYTLLGLGKPPRKVDFDQILKNVEICTEAELIYKSSSINYLKLKKDQRIYALPWGWNLDFSKPIFVVQSKKIIIYVYLDI